METSRSNRVHKTRKGEDGEMNQKNLAIQRNNIRRLLKHSSNIHTNCIRLNIGNTDEHEEKKFRLCRAFKKAGQHFICEAEFIKGGRADIINLDRMLIYEIVKSESKESLELKAHTYPLPIIKVYI